MQPINPRDQVHRYLNEWSLASIESFLYHCSRVTVLKKTHDDGFESRQSQKYTQRNLVHDCDTFIADKTGHLEWIWTSAKRSRGTSVELLIETKFNSSESFSAE